MGPILTAIQPETSLRRMEMKEGEPRVEKASTETEKPINEPPRKQKRQICDRCQRPRPRACICEALPDAMVALEETELVILQHPHELKHKNRSVPILQLCLDPSKVHLCVGRRLGDQIDPKIMELLQPPNLPILVYPSEEENDTTLSLAEAKKEIVQKKEQMQGQEPGGKVVVLVLDATWKYAREMHRANQQHQQYPSHVMRVSLTPKDVPDSFQPKRFDIRTTPETTDNQAWMSTAECIAFVLSALEFKPDLYSTIMKPLDHMVQKWNDCLSLPNQRERERPRKKQKR
jgi:DTW domain-containing protein YfiP